MDTQPKPRTFGLMLSGSADQTSKPSTSSGARVMGWLLVLMSASWPRLIVLAFWIFGSQLGRAFDSWVVPAIGFVVLPWTTVAYAFTWSISSDRVSGLEWAVVACALLADVLTWAGAARLLRR